MYLLLYPDVKVETCHLDGSHLTTTKKVSHGMKLELDSRVKEGRKHTKTRSLIISLNWINQ